MLNESQQGNVTTLGRMLMGLLFFFGGIGMITQGVDGAAGMIASKGLPMAMLLAWVVAILKLVAGGALMLGYKTKEAALALLAFPALATLLFHLSLEDVGLFKNLAIMGGLMYVLAYGPGRGWRI